MNNKNYKKLLHQAMVFIIVCGMIISNVMPVYATGASVKKETEVANDISDDKNEDEDEEDVWTDDDNDEDDEKIIILNQPANIIG